MLDKINGRGERPAMQIAVPHAGHCEPRTLDRKQRRDHIADCVPHRRIGHHRPVGVPFFAVVKNAAEHQQVNEVGEISQLNKIVEQRRSKLFQPHRRMHAKHPVIERNQLRILPNRIDQMNQVSEFLEAEQKKKMRIPVPPEMPEPRGQRNSILLRANFRARACGTQNQNQRGHNCLRADQLPRMSEIFLERGNQYTGKSQVPERHPLKRAARRPDPRQFASRASFQRSFSLCRQSQFGKSSCSCDGARVARGFVAGVRSQRHCAALIQPYSLFHRAASPFNFKARCSPAVRTGQCVHSSICQPRRRAMRRSRRVGFTAKGWPTAASIHRSSDESLYALHCASEIFCARANSLIAIAFASPNIAAPATRPVQQPSQISSRVASTEIFVSTPRHRSSRSSAYFTISASGASVPLTSTIESPRNACHHTRCNAAGNNSGSVLSASAPRASAVGAEIVSAATPRKYILFACVAAQMSRSPIPIASRSQAKQFLAGIFRWRQRFKKNLRSSEGFASKVPSISKKAAPTRFCSLHSLLPYFISPSFLTPPPRKIFSHAPQPLRAQRIAILQSAPAIREANRTPQSPRSESARWRESSDVPRWRWSRAAPPARASTPTPIRDSRSTHTSTRRRVRGSSAKPPARVPTRFAAWRSLPIRNVLPSVRAHAENRLLLRARKTKPAATTKPFRLPRNK